MVNIEHFLSSEGVSQDILETTPFSQKALGKKRQYFRSQMKLLAALSQDINKDAQDIISQLFPPEALLFCLNSTQIGILDKKIMLDIMNNIYLKFHLLKALPTSLMPTIFTWNKDKKKVEGEGIEEENYDLEEHRMAERYKIFSLSYFNQDFEELDLALTENVENVAEEEEEGDKRKPNAFVKMQSVWAKNNLDEALDSLPNQQSPEVEKDTKEINIIRKMSLDITSSPARKGKKKKGNVYNMFKKGMKGLTRKNLLQKRDKHWKKVKENRNFLHEFVIHTLENPVSWESDLESLQFYIGFFQMLRFLLLRRFFDEDYNNHM